MEVRPDTDERIPPCTLWNYNTGDPTQYFGIPYPRDCLTVIGCDHYCQAKLKRWRSPRVGRINCKVQRHLCCWDKWLWIDGQNVLLYWWRRCLTNLSSPEEASHIETDRSWEDTLEQAMIWGFWKVKQSQSNPVILVWKNWGPAFLLRLHEARRHQKERLLLGNGTVNRYVFWQ